MKIIEPKRIDYYTTRDGRQPFKEWMVNLDDKTQAIITKRLDQIESGLFGDTKSLGDGLFELRIHFGSGYRIYFANKGTTLVIILSGNSKHHQNHDIIVAKTYWKDYQMRFR